MTAPVALTLGDPAGIGGEIALKACFTVSPQNSLAPTMHLYVLLASSYSIIALKSIYFWLGADWGTNQCPNSIHFFSSNHL